MQLAHFLRAAAAPWATRLCDALSQQHAPKYCSGRVLRSQRQDTSVAQLLEEAPTDVAEAILQHHPVLQSAIPLADKLAQLPPVAHLPACRSCIPEGDDTWPLDLDDAWEATWELLQHAPEGRTVHVHVPEYLPHSVTTPRVAALAERIAAAPRVQSLRLPNVWRECALAALLPRLTALTALDLVTRKHDDMLDEPPLTRVWPHLLPLASLQRLSGVLSAEREDGADDSAEAQVLARLTDLTLVILCHVAFLDTAEHLRRATRLSALSVDVQLFDEVASSVLSVELIQQLLPQLTALTRLDLNAASFGDYFPGSWCLGHNDLAVLRAPGLRHVRIARAWVGGMTTTQLDSMSTLTSLQQLSLAGSLDATHLAALCAHSSALTALTLLRGARPAAAPVSTSAVIAALGNLSRLTSISFEQSSHAGDADLQSFIEQREKLLQLQHVTLPWPDAACGTQAATLAAQLATLPQLRAIAYSGSDHKAADVIAHCAARINSLRSLQVPLRNNLDPQLTTALHAIAAQTQLTELQLHSAPFFAPSRASGIERLTKLRSLVVGHQHIAPSTLGHLTQLTRLEMPVARLERGLLAAIASLSYLERLRSSHGHLCAADASELFAQFAGLTRLSLLELKNHPLVTGDVQQMSTQLAGVSSLVELNLAHCGFTDAHVCLVAPVLARLPCLRTLEIDFQAFGDAGLRALVVACVCSRAVRHGALDQGRACI